MKRNLLTFLCSLILITPDNFAQTPATQREFYDISSIADVEIRFGETNWQYMLDSLRVNGDKMLVATVKIDGSEYKNVGVRYAGTRGYVMGGQRNTLILKLNLIHRSQHHQGFKTLRFSNALRDPSMIREVLSYQVAREYMPAPRANFVNVKINGNMYGLMVNVQNVDGQFVEEHFSTNDGSFFKANPPIDLNEPEGCKKKAFCNLYYEPSASCYLYNYEMLSEYGWDDLIELTRVLNEDLPNVEQVLNVDRALWMLAFNNVLVNLNSYTGSVSENYYLYRDGYGRFNPILWDMNLSFGSFKNTGSGSDLDLKGLQQMDPFLHEKNPAKPLISQLLSNEHFRRVYTSHMRTILYEWFVNDKYLKQARELQALIEPVLAKDPNKFYSMEEFKASLDKTIGTKSKIPGIHELMDKRASFLKKQKELAIIPPAFEPPYVKGRDPLVSTNISDFKIQTKVSKFTRQVHIYYRFEGESTFRMQHMADDGKHEDNEAGDQVYGIVLKPEKGSAIEYYFVAENVGAIAFDPPNYMFNLHRADLAELNK